MCKHIEQRNEIAESKSDIRSVFDCQLSQEILRSDTFVAVELAREYEAVFEQIGTDLSSVIALFEVMPTFLNGEAHSESRKAMAIVLAQTRAELEADLRNEIEARVDALFLPSAQFDLVSELCKPIFAVIAAKFAEGADPLPPQLHEIPLLFGTTMKLNRRKALNAAISDFMQNGTEGYEERRKRLALAALGHDTLVGTLALSLAAVFDAHPNIKMSDYRWPQTLTVSSLPYADRVASADTEIRGEKFRSGERVRLYLANPQGSIGGDPSLIFGKGSHTCLGKSISQFTWSAVVKKMQQLQFRVSIGPIEFRSPDTLFHFPKRIEVTIDG